MENKIPQKGVNRFASAMLEKKLIEKHYECMRCTVSRDGLLKAKGCITPTDISETYEFIIEYLPYHKPVVNIERPRIEYSNDIHIYSDGSLCLYYLGDMRWDKALHIHNTIIPWTAEWILFYELYKITGKWEHPYVPHGKLKKP